MLERGKKTERFGFQYPGPYKKGDIENYIQHFHKHDEDNNKLKYQISLTVFLRQCQVFQFRTYPDLNFIYLLKRIN